MTREVLLAQLFFDILMLSALYVLSRQRPPRPSRDARHTAESAAPVPLAQRWFGRGLKRKPEARPPVPAGDDLAPLIENAETRELVAEAALRARLARFKERAS
jgi:hypothetical protein